MSAISLPMPPSLNKLRAVVRGRIITTAEGRAWKTEAMQRAYMAGMKPVNGPVKVVVTLMPRQNKDGSASKVRPDLDNITKVTLDAMKGLMFDDDKQIEHLTVKLGGALPKGAITVECQEMTDQDRLEKVRGDLLHSIWSTEPVGALTNLDYIVNTGEQHE